MEKEIIAKTYLEAAKLEFNNFNGAQKVIPIVKDNDYKMFPELKLVTGHCSYFDKWHEIREWRVFGYLLAYNISLTTKADRDE